MSEEPEVLPTDKSLPAPQVTINQFIQLVNQNNRFPDASALSQYDPETPAWILKRTEVEQDNRHIILHKLVDNEHALATLKIAEPPIVMAISQKVFKNSDKAPPAAPSSPHAGD